MTDIEKKAREYAEEQINGIEFANDYERTCEIDNYRCAFLAGASYALGNQWRDAEKELPEDCEDVVAMEVRGNYHNIGIAWCDKNPNGKKQWYSNDDDFGTPFVKFWMPIPAISEYKPKEECV